MIIENEDELNAFKFVCNLASLATDRICNDLEKDDIKKFGHLKVESVDVDDKTFMRPISLDFDIIEWLKKQVRV